MRHNSESAFKHGETEADIRNAFSTALYDEAGNYDDSTIFVFHAMKCRKEYLKYIER